MGGGGRINKIYHKFAVPKLKIMTKERFILLGMLCISLVGHLKAQETNGKVGINTTTPTRTLTIENSSNNAGKPVLRLVGTPEYSENINSAMGTNKEKTTVYTDYHPLMIDSNGDVYKGVPISSTVSVLTLKVSNVEGDWISNFDTGINYEKYAIAIMSYSFLPGGVNGGNYDMLVMETANPNVIDGTNTLSRVAPPIVKLQQTGDNWGISADYISMSSKRTPSRGSTGAGDKINGTWIFTLLVGRRDLVNFVELEFNQNGVNWGKGKDNPTYKAKLESVLKKLD